MKPVRPPRFQILVCYDVNTTTPTGEKRLRRVSKVCVGYGQRVQYSVFECSLSETLMEAFREKLLDIIDQKEDSLRIYYLYGPREKAIETYGRDHYVDFQGPLLV